MHHAHTPGTKHIRDLYARLGRTLTNRGRNYRGARHL